MFPRLPCFDSCKPLVPNNCCIHMQNECQFVNKQNIFPGTSFRMFLYLSLIQNLIWYQNSTIFLVWDVWLITEHLNSWDHIGWTDPLWINRNREGISIIKRSSSSALHVNPIQPTLLKKGKHDFAKHKTHRIKFYTCTRETVCFFEHNSTRMKYVVSHDIVKWKNCSIKKYCECLGVYHETGILMIMWFF